MKTRIPSPELLDKMDAYRRAANYLSVGQICLYDNPLLEEPLTPTGHFTEGEGAILTRSRR